MGVKIVDGDLVCPLCENKYLRQGATSVYQRVEDEAACTLTVVDGFSTEVNARATNAGNPSARRQGLTIQFTCETSGDPKHPDTTLELCIAQHKGMTEVYWRHEAR